MYCVVIGLTVMKMYFISRRLHFEEPNPSLLYVFRGHDTQHGDTAQAGQWTQGAGHRGVLQPLQGVRGSGRHHCELK